ncbi:ZrgA family zinc uptake protein, partial [Pseudomonas sp. R62]
MRRLLLALPFALLPLAAAHAVDEHDHDHEHGSLGAHEHGVGRLNAALDGQTLELELESPAMNLVGFEHAATSDADKAKVAAARAQLEK